MDAIPTTTTKPKDDDQMMMRSEKQQHKTIDPKTGRIIHPRPKQPRINRGERV
jgi:hypothetical protein